MSRADRPRHGTPRGQSTVEFALMAPLVVYCAMVLVGTAGLCLDLVRVHEVARSATRAAITASDPSVAAGAVAGRFGFRAVTSIDERTGLVTVTVRRRRALPVPIIGRLLPGLVLAGTATMVHEPPVVLG